MRYRTNMKEQTKSVIYPCGLTIPKTDNNSFETIEKIISKHGCPIHGNTCNEYIPSPYMENLLGGSKKCLIGEKRKKKKSKK